MDPVVVTFVILGLAVVAFVSGRIPIAVVAIGVALALWATGVLTLEQSLAGFGDPTVLFIASLFVVSEGLDATGVTARLGRLVVARGGASRNRVLLLVMALVALLTALISVNGAVAALLPMAVVVAVRIGLPPSQLLLPLAFSAHAGSLLALTGTPVNVIVSEFAAEEAGGPFGYFEFALVGAPLVVGTLLLAMLLGKRMLPARSADTVPRDLTDHARTLLADYSGLAEADGGGRAVLIDAENGVAEVMVPPRSELVGMRVFPGMATPSGKLVILALARNGRELTGPDADVEVGDVLLLQGTWDDLEANTGGDEVRVVDAPSAVRGQAAPIGTRGVAAIVVLAAMVVLLATGLVPAVVAGLLAAGAMILTRVVSIGRAYRAISWTTVILVAGMIPLSTAFTTTGAAEIVGNALVAAAGPGGPLVVLLAVCVLVVVLGQLISNMATALIVAPIALSAAAELGVSGRPFLMALTVVAAAAFLTPIATPVNLMVMGPGGYRFGDYARFGWPFTLLFLAVAVLLVPLIWPF
ncbi:SLC13 family permease [Agromyces badenianii]|uniref:SLC13 family permease n=1 Tax=Agromyces badenianii TaxID=2080742 RepID=UPI000D5956C0|nr:SLC13 family permease [Agromyces badenianii]PWC05702.1 di-/tricarboxylate transporter [Agromyces badenianii]